jgi:hypothetical protein
MFYRYCGLTARLQGQKYARLENSAALPQADTLEDFQSNVIPMLLAVGPYASLDPVLLYKVLRIAKTALKIVSQNSFFRKYCVASCNTSCSFPMTLLE